MSDSKVGRPQYPMAAAFSPEKLRREHLTLNGTAYLTLVKSHRKISECTLIAGARATLERTSRDLIDR